ncbi:SUMF1/EgtB/PvdO family nonheme iron enzyme [Borrelia coriaceae]|uniref:SUMF1/EgtB/PvdO family nonheme iron enzyme n=1 Tax=Borrelia coriaceae TaxID=144 RepID=UPI000483BB26|nr:SUMF1/EgtB/PvdO family nonheme iron enzyme [Borrelia coriaceae]UPA15913.1 SUMF1/EgtB/PvdO family nonheme iron enzyme [Borrelia coriaceae]
MFKKNDGFNINEELLTVKLKPILGIIPKVYVTFTIIILPLIIILSLIINTKLNNPGAYLKIKTNINNAHVYLDEKYIGRTPLKKYINATKGTIKIQRLGFESYEKKIEIQHRFFTSYQLNIDLKLKDPDKIIAQRQKELSIMTKIKNTNDNTKLIPIFSFIVNDLQSSPKHIKKFFKTSIAYIHSDTIFKDFLVAYKNIYSINDNNNQKIWKSLQQNFNLEDRAIIWFFENLDKEQQKQISNETWFKTLIKKLKNENKILKFETKNINLPLTNFKKIKSQNIASIQNYKLYSQNFTLKTTYKLKEFLIQNKNVTKAEYQKFLNENPKWTLNNKDNLIKKELVDESYLKTFKQMSSNEDITHISYHAAIEYARWYSSNLPKGFKARLPISQEWELYQKEVPKAIESLNINEISKKVGFWNLMQNSSFNESFLFQDTNDIYPENSNFNSLITEIRTYNYNNNPTLKPSTKASFLKHWCSPNIGFRIVIEKE